LTAAWRCGPESRNRPSQFDTGRARVGNARTIADIEFVVDAPSLGSEKNSWQSHGVECSRDRHRFSGQTYSFSLEVLHLRLIGTARSRWHVVIVSELWRFEGAKAESRGTKSLKVIQGKGADVVAWMRRCRGKKA
jgi:hypothetical protein